jgi:hypothetical protein
VFAEWWAVDELMAESQGRCRTREDWCRTLAGRIWRLKDKPPGETIELTLEEICWACQSAKLVVRGEKTVLWLDPPCAVVGDIHGNIQTLLNVLTKVRLARKLF